MTPEEVRKSLPALLNHHAYKQGIKDANEKLSTPINLEEMEIFMRDNPKFVSEHAASKWQEIVETTELSVQRRRQIIDQGLRAICFSDPSRVKADEELLLWSHYAKKHEGVRIGFEFPGEFIARSHLSLIHYEPKRVEVVFSLGDEVEALKALEKSATVKSKVWEYEREYRLFVKLDSSISETITNSDSTRTVEYFLKFQRDWVKSVDFGVFCPASEIQRIITLLRAGFPNAIARKAEFHRTEYALDYKQIH